MAADLALCTADKEGFLGGASGKKKKKKKKPPGDAGDLREGVHFLGQEDPLEEEMTTHFSVLVLRILWMEEPGGL